MSKYIYTKGFSRPFLFTKNEETKTAWFTGTLMGCSHFQVMCKLIRAILWNNIAGKKKVVKYIVYWHKMHDRTFDFDVFNHALAFVYDAIKVDLQIKRAEAKYEYRKKKKELEEQRQVLIA